MKEVLVRTWIPGTPRGYGNAAVAGQWISEIATALRPFGLAPLAEMRLSLELEFHVCACGPKYGGHNRLHGTDLDNLIKQTIDGLSVTKTEAMPGLGLIPDDSAIYEIKATKSLASKDDESGVFLTIWALDP